MKQENINYVTVGAFVLVILSFFMVAIYQIASDGIDLKKYKIRYGSIMGIKKGSPVSYHGNPVGSVTDISRVHKDGRTTFEVEISINSDYKIPELSVAHIVTPNFLSEQQIDIHEVSSKLYLKQNDTITGEQEVSFMTLMNNVAQEVNSVSTTSIKPLLHNLSRHIDKIGNKLTVQIPQIAENTNKLLLNLNQGADHINRILGSENQKYIRNILINADKISGKFYQMSEKMDSARIKLSLVLENTNKILDSNKQDVRHSVIAFRKSLETVSNRINTIVYNIEQTSRNFSEFSRKIRQNPGSLIGGKSPKEQGVFKR